ncbi:MAG TPA: ABC transporter substrate-binding protein [Thermodesulfobacteriota bacterium]
MAQRLLAVALAVAVTAGFALARSADAAPLRIGYSTWVGYGPLFLARDLGYFREAGVEVEMVLVEDPKVRFTALAAGQLDGLVSTVDTLVLYLKQGNEYQHVLALDDSAGGDGLVANKAIADVKGLKGKKVALVEGSVSHFFLAVLLRRNGLGLRDVQIVNVDSAGNAATAFIAKQVDGAVTWEPHLTRAKTTAHGHELVSSAKTPGLITDTLIFRRSVIETRAREIQAIAKGWDRAVAYWKERPDDANAKMSAALGSWLKDPKVFAETLTGIRYYTLADNQRFFGTPERPGAILDTARNSVEIWGELGKLPGKPDPKETLSWVAVTGAR